MSVLFTNTQYLSTTSVPASQTIKSSPLSMAVWAYCTTSGSSILDTGGDIGVYMAVVGSATSGSSFTNWISIGNSASVGSVYLDISHASTTEEIFVEYGSTTNNAWVHWAMTYSGSGTTAGVKIYKNGALVTPVSSGGSITTADAWARIIVGGSNATLQDAVCFNRVLTASEIAMLAAGRFPPVDMTSVVGWWPLMNGDRTTDISGNGRNLTATGSPVDGVLQPPVSWWGKSPTIILPAVTATNLTASGTTASSATAAVSFNQQFPVNATSTTNSSATATVSKSQVFSITATGTTNSSAAATDTVTATLTASGTTNSSGSAAIGIGIQATGTTASSATAAVSISTSTNITAAAQTASSASAAMTITRAITAVGQTASSASAQMTITQAITAAGTTASSASAGVNPTFPLNATGTSASSAQGAIGSLLMATGSTASSAAASFGSATFPALATGTTASFATAAMTSSGGGGGGAADGDGAGWRRWVMVGARRRIRR